MSGFLASIRKACDDGLAAVQNRVELFRLELREEKWRFIETVVLVLAAFFLSMLAILLLSATVLFSFKDEARIYVAAVLCVASFLGAGWAFLSVKKRVKSDAGAFSETAAQLRKDREWLDSLK
jgi:uncharacterized membrane protein YqjE